MAHSHSRRTFPTAHHQLTTPVPRSRAHSIISQSSFASPRATPPPSRRGTTRGLRATSIASDTLSQLADNTPGKTSIAPKGQLADHYFLPPTVPSPYTGTLDASLDAIMSWGVLYGSTPGVQGLITALQEPVKKTTDWPFLLSAVNNARYITEELLFLVTRTLLPEQVTENRGLMRRLYDRKKQLAIRLILRYDMLREWKMEVGSHNRDQAVAVPSLPPTGLAAPTPLPAKKHPHRRAQLPNIIPTLIAAPQGGFGTHGVRERMRHHVTDFDAWLLLSDDEVAKYSDTKLLFVTSQVALQWQWLVKNNELLYEMENMGWEELEGKADENEWIAEDVRRTGKRDAGKGEEDEE
jgi:hypothetical protein